MGSLLAISSSSTGTQYELGRAGAIMCLLGCPLGVFLIGLVGPALSGYRLSLHTKGKGGYR